MLLTNSGNNPKYPIKSTTSFVVFSDKMKVLMDK